MGKEMFVIKKKFCDICGITIYTQKHFNGELFWENCIRLTSILFTQMVLCCFDGEVYMIVPSVKEIELKVGLNG